MADTTLLPTPDNVTDEEALLLGDVLTTGKPVGCSPLHRMCPHSATH